jgi:hypothetical protein
VGILSERIGVGSGESEVGKFDVEGLSFDEDVLRFEVSVDNSVGVAVLE